MATPSQEAQLFTDNVGKIMSEITGFTYGLGEVMPRLSCSICEFNLSTKMTLGISVLNQI